jgi:cation transport ATPase
MTNQSQTPSPSAPPPPSGDWREQRRAERQAAREARWQRHGRYRSNWIWGIILILLGVVFLLQNMGMPFPLNWWALFILIPAFWSFVAAWDNYRENGRLTRAAAGSLTVGVLLAVLTAVFLFNLGFGILWPFLLILGGLALLMIGLVPA